jgi:hypothetical protein
MKKLVAFAIVAFLGSRVFGASYTLTPQATNAQVGYNSGGIYTAAQVRVGNTSSGTFGCAAVYVFAFPRLQSFDEKITGANLQINLAVTKGQPFTFNGDLYSLGLSSSNLVVGSDYYNGTYTNTASQTGIEQHFLTPSTAIGYVTPTTSAASELASDLDMYRGGGASAGSFYFLRVSPDFSAPTDTVNGYNVSLVQDTAPPTLTVTTSTPPQLGRVLWEYWTGITGSTVASLTGTTAYTSDQPTSREFPQVLEIPYNMKTLSGAADINSGDRMMCYFYPPVTGAYTFAIAGDDNTEFLFSTNATPGPSNAVVEASVSVNGSDPGYTGYQAWTAYAGQQWTSPTLNAGQKYFIETIHKQSGGGSNCSVGWIPAGAPGGTALTLMPATYCAPYDLAPAYTANAITNIKTQAHPRLMLSIAEINRMANEITTGTPQYSATQAARWTAIKSVAMTDLSAAVINPETGPGQANSNYINAARELQDRIYYMSLFYLIDSQINPTDTSNLNLALSRIYAELQSAQQWGSTNWAEYQFLDLPEISHAFAIAYDWCYGAWSGTAAPSGVTAPSGALTLILNAISTQGLAKGVAAYTANDNYITGINDGNWCIVCDSGLTFSALAILGDETSNPQAPTLLNDIMPIFTKSTCSSMAEWGPDGGWPEGPCYWSFAARYLTTFMSCLETSAGTCYGIDNLSGIANIGAFPLYYMSPLNENYGFSDEESSAGSTDFIPGQQYLGVRYNQPVYSDVENSSNYPTDMVWWDPRTGYTPASVGAPTSAYFQTSGVSLMRTAWNNVNASFIGTKGGYNAAVTPYGSGHEDMELGGFVYDALGVRWAVDLSRDSYGLPNYFDINPWDTVNRWQYYRMRAEGNNTLVINPTSDGGQYYGGTAPLASVPNPFLSNSTVQQTIFDMTTAYSKLNPTSSGGTPAATPVTKALRGFRLVDGVMQMQDEVTSSSAVDLNWFMHTDSTITISTDKKTVTLTPTKGNLNSRLQMTMQSPSGATFKSMSATPLPNSPGGTNDVNPGGISPPLDSQQTANTGVNKVWVELSASGTTTLTVLMVPYTSGQTPTTTVPAQTALSNW